MVKLFVVLVICVLVSAICYTLTLLFFDEFIHTVSAVAEPAQTAQFLPDLVRKLVWRLYRVNALGPARKRPASQTRIVIQGGEFEPLLEGLHCALERLRRYGLPR